MVEFRAMWAGNVSYLNTASKGSAPMDVVSEINLIESVGIEGDRYATESGFYSDRPEPGRQVTLFEIETLQTLKRDHDVDLEPHEHRRNITVQGVPLNHLVGKRFWVGGTLLEATRLSTPCKHIEDITGKVISRWLIHRCGLNCIILQGGKVRLGDAVKPH